MKAKVKDSIYLIVLTIVTIIWLTAMSLWAFSQTITMTARQNINTIVVDFTYTGDTFAMGSFGARLNFDATIYELQHIIPAPRYNATGVFSATAGSSIATGTIGFMWWATDFYDTLWADNKPLCRATFKVLQSGCSPFTFWQDGWCDMADIEGLPYIVTFVDTMFCTSAYRAERVQPKAYHYGKFEFNK